MNKAIGMVEYSTVSTGMQAADTIVKTADVEIIEASTVCPGKYMVGLRIYRNNCLMSFDDISDECVVINDYGEHNFTDYYYEESTDSFYVFNGIKYRKLHINYKRNGSAFVIINDTENKRVQLIISRFKRLYGFI